MMAQDHNGVWPNYTEDLEEQTMQPVRKETRKILPKYAVPQELDDSAHAQMPMKSAHMPVQSTQMPMQSAQMPAMSAQMPAMSAQMQLVFGQASMMSAQGVSRQI